MTDDLTEQHGMLIIILEKEIYTKFKYIQKLYKEIYTKFVSIFYLLFIKYIK